jgi:hypothetical protein
MDGNPALTLTGFFWFKRFVSRNLQQISTTERIKDQANSKMLPSVLVINYFAFIKTFKN